MLKLPNFTKSTLLATFFLLLTGCNDTSKTDTETIESPTSLTITISKTTLNKDENTTVKVMAEYKGRATKEVTDKVEWIVTPKDAVIVTEKILIAKKDTSTTLNAKLGTTLSNTVNLNIVWIVNGYTLPPEPDKTVNDSTLLGIDVNGNGVRDDVERWIYEKYKDMHPIHMDIAMQAGRAWQKVLEDPSKAKEIYPIVDAPSYCESYYKIYAEYFNKPLLVQNDINTKYFRQKILFNTKEREEVFWKFDKLLSGDSYTLPQIGNGIKYCDFNTSRYEK
jgi:hypothetical protein